MVACISILSGVCGAAARTKTTQLVPDVHQSEGHIACSSSTRSELVIPICKDGEVIAVLDLDSDELAAFTQADVDAMEPFCAWLGERL